MTGKMIPIVANDGGKFSAYLALPPAGKGPGLIVLQEIFGVNRHIRDVADHYAEEGYVVLAPDLFWRMQPGVQLGYTGQDSQQALGFYQRFDVDQGMKDIADTVRTLRGMHECDGKVGALGFCLGGKLAYLAAIRCEVNAAISYYGVAIEQNLDEARKIKCPILFHFAGKDRFVTGAAREQIRKALVGRDDAEFYLYPDADHGFDRRSDDSFHASSASLAQSRTLAVLHRALGPRYDLNALWGAHTADEFDIRDVDQTMATMVKDAYVNHIPTMTGGTGYKNLHAFYKNHFIPGLPKDVKITPVSRTIGSDRVVDELVFSFTHDIEIDWMLPGVPPTGRHVDLPLIAIVQFRGGKIYNEHIYWDQASLLIQVGLLEPHGLPIVGIDATRKLLDETLPSNTLIKPASK